MQVTHGVYQDFDREPYTGDVDTVTGFALVASATTCFVWKYAQVRVCTLESFMSLLPSEYTTGFDWNTDMLHFRMPS